MKDAIPVREALEEMGHPQPPTPIVVDNSTAAGIANKTVKQRQSKAMDMRFYWVQDRIEQKQFLVYWRQGAENLADYFTKHHPARYHVQMRPVYLHSSHSNLTLARASDLRGCVDPSPKMVPIPLVPVTDSAHTPSRRLNGASAMAVTIAGVPFSST